ncbi:MAG TPA: wax ester/triacylglycerol synthase family O-acyltransferase [Marmoricola sp.]|nr:wax ester/triacylglycerol synthase family O-acyltransferase [Marmoricola sp.]
MERLSGLDASFLYLESSAQLMHVCGVLLLDPSTTPGGYSFAGMKDVLEARVATIPSFRRKLKEVPLEIDHPVWVDDRDFDIDRHVHRLAVPAPGGPEELREVCGHLAGIPLDRSRPLWEMWVIEGLASGHVAVFTKMHHASVDGVSGANLVSYLCSLEPDAPLPDLPPMDESSAEPGDWELFGRGLLNTLAKPVKAVQLVGPTASLITKTIARARSGTAMAAPLTAPRTSFNGNISGRRSVGYSELSLDRIKEIRHAVDGATVNDVVLAISGGALRRYLEDRGELPSSSLLASVPVSVHGTSTKSSGTNKVSSLFARLGTDIADPVERLRRLAQDNAHAKDHHKAISADTLQDWAEFAAPRTFGLAVRAVARLRLAEKGPVIHNLVISNVPGPPVPLYFVGARIEAFYPLGPIFHGAALNVTVMSNNGRMHVGLLGCRDALPQIQDLADDFPAELDALYAAAVG